MTPTDILSSFRFRFSLKTLLVLVGAICVLLGWWANNARRQKHAVEIVGRKNGGVAYTFNRRPNNQPPPPPAWMMHRDVRDYFFDVVGIGLLDDSDFRDCDLELLRDLPEISSLHLEGDQFTDEAIEHIVRCKHLRYLALLNTRVGDKGLARLATLATLQEIVLYDNVNTDNGVAKLQRALPDCRIAR